MSFTVNRYDIPTERFAPSEVVIREVKYCELCGKPFVRKRSGTRPTPVEELEHLPAIGKGRNHVWEYVKVVHELRRDTGAKFCEACCSRMLLPDIEAQERYRAQLPTEAEQRHSHHLPRYDQSLTPMGRVTSAHKVNCSSVRSRRRYTRSVEWKDSVVTAFRERGRLTSEDLCELIPNCCTPWEATVRVRAAKLAIRLVDRFRRPGIKGPGLGIFVLEEVTTIQ